MSHTTLPEMSIPEYGRECQLSRVKLGDTAHFPFVVTIQFIFALSAIGIVAMQTVAIMIEISRTRQLPFGAIGAEKKLGEDALP